jgi:hypothetical protein
MGVRIAGWKRSKRSHGDDSDDQLLLFAEPAENGYLTSEEASAARRIDTALAKVSELPCRVLPWTVVVFAHFQVLAFIALLLSCSFPTPLSA